MNIQWSVANRTGLVLTILLGLANLPSFLEKTPDGQVGPPYSILVADTVLGGIMTVAAVTAWIRVSKSAARLASAANILAMLTALPAFFVPVPPSIKALVGVITVITVVAVSLTLSRPRTTGA